MLSDLDNGGDKENQAPAEDTWEDDIRSLGPIVEGHSTSADEATHELRHCDEDDPEALDVGTLGGLRTPDRRQEPEFTTGIF